MTRDDLKPEEWFRVRHVRDTGAVFFECSTRNPVLIAWLIGQAVWAFAKKYNADPKKIMVMSDDMLNRVLEAEEEECQQ